MDYALFVLLFESEFWNLIKNNKALFKIANKLLCN